MKEENAADVKYSKTNITSNKNTLDDSIYKEHYVHYAIFSSQRWRKFITPNESFEETLEN